MPLSDIARSKTTYTVTGALGTLVNAWGMLLNQPQVTAIGSGDALISSIVYFWQKNEEMRKNCEILSETITEFQNKLSREGMRFQDANQVDRKVPDYDKSSLGFYQGWYGWNLNYFWIVGILLSLIAAIFIGLRHDDDTQPLWQKITGSTAAILVVGALIPHMLAARNLRKHHNALIQYDTELKQFAATMAIANSDRLKTLQTSSSNDINQLKQEIEQQKNELEKLKTENNTLVEQAAKQIHATDLLSEAKGQLELKLTKLDTQSNKLRKKYYRLRWLLLAIHASKQQQRHDYQLNKLQLLGEAQYVYQQIRTLLGTKQALITDANLSQSIDILARELNALVAEFDDVV